MIKDTLNSLKGVLYERISSPLWGTYFVAWVLYNWEIVLIFFGGSSIKGNEAELIKAYLYSEDGFNYSVVFFPLCMTVTLLALVPIFQTLYFVYSEFIKMLGKTRRDRFESNTRLTIEQSNELRRRIINISASSQEITSFQDQEINSLKDSIKNLQSSLDSTEPNEELERLTQQLNEMKRANAEISANLTEIKTQEIKDRIDYSVDAVDIETAFARITGEKIGARGLFHDADVFRGGRVSDISKALGAAIEAIETRVEELAWSENDKKSGEIGAQTQVAISQLKAIVKYMENHERLEPHDYHWSIVASLFTIINALLTTAERQKNKMREISYKLSDVISKSEADVKKRSNVSKNLDSLYRR
ncbi:hypothetical protein CYL31_15040 [Marinomonas sp. A3A]|uniref:hypothetical protein n=1 Tax=Marinomonas sp. A3A TaxID=2065312 RepID=UPI001BB2FB3E|nr:hypothetical protein [Marinomonas sp. A3A]QUX92632.1 hypothetical protein CYL31_15040 [Marinomonas sp. A3A]